MNNSCNCAHCPHSCGDEKNVEKNDDEPTDAEAMAGKASDKVEKLKQAILNLGFKLEDTEKGIRVTM